MTINANAVASVTKTDNQPTASGRSDVNISCTLQLRSRYRNHELNVLSRISTRTPGEFQTIQDSIRPRLNGDLFIDLNTNP